MCPLCQILSMVSSFSLPFSADPTMYSSFARLLTHGQCRCPAWGLNVVNYKTSWFLISTNRQRRITILWRTQIRPIENVSCNTAWEKSLAKLGLSNLNMQFAAWNHFLNWKQQDQSYLMFETLGSAIAATMEIWLIFCRKSELSWWFFKPR